MERVRESVQKRKQLPGDMQSLYDSIMETSQQLGEEISEHRRGFNE